jgi:hypothetical protein
MAERPVAFDRASAELIRRVVKQVLAEPGNRVGPRMPYRKHIITPVSRVKLTQTGGSAGSASTACNFTYTVTDLADNELATAAAPEWPSRAEYGLKVAASAGLAYQDVDGAWQIAVAFERAGVGSC